jgi:prepilin-type N-terminal cleavage/methylation domain-containing protein
MGWAFVEKLLSRLKPKEQTGFTLIELMIVVGIIGILVSISGPQYRRYQNKARQAEAKVALGAIYSLEKAFYSEYSAYALSFAAIGYAPEGNRRFYRHQTCSGANVTAWAGTVTGYGGSTGIPLY